ncbi:MAG: 1,4-beta-xylanase [Candidatus Solibacter sp.]
MDKIAMAAGRMMLLVALAGAAMAQPARWTEKAINEWYARQPWLVGANYVPATAINQLEMWQTESFDPVWMDTELGRAEGLGMTTLRVFLHDLMWKQDAGAFQSRINKFLSLCDKHKIKPIFVLFDSCWDPFPDMDTPRPPKPGVHNSGWMQSPGIAGLRDPGQTERLRQYVQGIIGAYRYDKRVLAWDLWNEPDNTNDSSYKSIEPPNKVALVQALLPKVFEWARAMLPEQPLTSGVWKGDWNDPAKLTPIQKTQLEQSDFITFHNYDGPAEFEKRVQWLQAYKRPIICTEYMARPRGSTFQAILPIGKKYNVGMINWGLVNGKTQTHLPWDSWQKPYTEKEPAVWFHDIFHKDGTPYSEDEVGFIRQMTGYGVKTKKAKGGK